MAQATDRFSPLMVVSERPQIVMTEGHGSWLQDETGKRYLDFVQGWAVNCLGHSPKVASDVFAAQSARLINCGPAFYTEPMVRLASLLTKASGLDRAFFTNSGAEANEGAIKLARKWGKVHRGGAFEIITFKNSFHGRTLATMSASGKAGWDELFEPKVPGFPKATINDIASVAALITRNTAGVLLEPIQGEGGVNPATDEFMRDLRALTEREGVLLLLDEVQTGIGRTGKLFAFEHSGAVPDILTLGKGIGAGAPLGAMIARESVCCFDFGDQGGTFNGNALVTAVGCAVLETVDTPEFLANVVAVSSYLVERLAAICERFGHVEVRGRGLLVALLLRENLGGQLVARARELGLLINSPRPNVLRFMPALTVTRDEIDQMIALLEAALDSSR